MVTFSRKNSPCKILKDGEVVGMIEGTLTIPKQFCLTLKGKYWKASGEITSKGGNTCQWYKTLAKAKQAAIQSL